MDYKNWLQLILDKRVVCLDSNTITVLIKMRYASTEIVFTLTGRNNFVTVAWFRKQ